MICLVWPCYSKPFSMLRLTLFWNSLQINPFEMSTPAVFHVARTISCANKACPTVNLWLVVQVWRVTEEVFIMLSRRWPGLSLTPHHPHSSDSFTVRHQPADKAHSISQGSPRQSGSVSVIIPPVPSPVSLGHYDGLWLCFFSYRPSQSICWIISSWYCLNNRLLPNRNCLIFGVWLFEVIWSNVVCIKWMVQKIAFLSLKRLAVQIMSVSSSAFIIEV